MSSSNNQSNTFQERRNKLSVWVKRIIQPNKDHKAGLAGARPGRSMARRTEPESKERAAESSESVVSTPRGSHSSSSSSARSVRSVQTAPARCKLRGGACAPAPRVEFEGANDNASTVPLVSMCSSSLKSSTFSDVHSVQSTRATVFSNKTFDTNSSTIGIPPASIVDRGRHTVAAPSVLSIGTSQTPQPPQGRGSNRHANSIHTSVSLTSIATILDS
ncbi:ADR326Cp [Eremothecium gossypii ATCC 10895]|uniref:ADR326Cp n=1 Tax=Eremothecium gossypii (strain ATCC 10895 / CBS 109.51 / FGSC 9923 / NRRL Y-1056) TaxID=284811 RepID=Q759I5_EREGS|nr:ADR326Cp [Eremothecium gossypii ATCC 10895]AAS52246.2 ADR326Cp [Eremothecium gossypii ATCC 10895]AEY96545.1 FADR326Cp [Eremothecium gossypii FDAG1]